MRRSWPKSSCRRRGAKREELWSELLDMTVGGEDANRTRCVMEIRAGTGGEEAALFAHDLFQMYKHHSEKKGWRCEVMEASPTDRGGFSKITLAFEGEGVYRDLHYEGGTHRVQRVPETEAKGACHTERRDRGRAAGTGRRRNQSQARRLSARQVLRQRPRRAARQQDGVSRPPDASRDRDRCLDAG